MARTRSNLNSIARLLDASNRPIYAVDARRRVVYCNAALADWLDLESNRIVGRLVEFHSELVGETREYGDAAAPLVDLCPPPTVLSGEACSGTISCAARGGHLVHRHAQFVPIDAADDSAGQPLESGVLVLVSARDLSAEELSAEVTDDPSTDELHRTIRRFRKSQSGHYSIASLLGNSPAMTKVRAQVDAAAASGANTLIYGRTGSGRGHVARAIHYSAAGSEPAKLVAVDCRLTTDEHLRRAIESLHGQINGSRRRPTLLLENLDRLEPAYQLLLLNAFNHASFQARVIATRNRHTPSAEADAREVGVSENRAIDDADGTRSVSAAADLRVASLDPEIFEVISTITIHVPSVSERLEDLPILAQAFLEDCNRGSSKQVGSIRSDALDQLALYRWPGELDEFHEAIRAAHAASRTHEITAADLPAILHHASQKAARSRPRTERIVLDDLLAQIEREAIVRALAQVNGNKTEAADLLGMTRPRLYRRLVQLGLATELKDADPQMPEFIEQSADDES